MPRESTETGGPYRAPTPDIYTVLLAVALVALLMAILGLYLDMSVNNFQLRGAPSASMVSAPAAAVAFDGDRGDLGLLAGTLDVAAVHSAARA